MPCGCSAPFLWRRPATSLRANFLPPWQTAFACQILERGAWAEFCRLADPKAHPGFKEAYYSYAVGTRPAEFYFETDDIHFSTKDTEIDHPTDVAMAIDYVRGTYVYAYAVVQDVRTSTGVRDAEVRVYSSIDDFSNDVKDTQIDRLYCDSATILVDEEDLRP